MSLILIINCLILIINCQFQSGFYPLNLSAINPSLQTNTIERNSDFGSCLCDISTNNCDYLCCCDSDCSSELKKFWYDKGYMECIFSASSNLFCIAKSSVFYINERRGMKKIENPLTDEEICLEVDKTFEVTNTMPMIEDLTSNKANDLAITISSYQKEMRLNLNKEPTVSSYHYGVNLIETKTIGGVNVRTNFNFPNKNMYGICDNLQTVQFQVDKELTTCIRQTILPNDCQISSFLSKDYYLSRNILVNPKTLLNMAIKTSNFYIKLDDQDNYQITDSNPTIGYIPSSQCICSNVVSGVIYTIETDSNIIQNINADVYFLSNLVGDCLVNIQFEQFFQVKFVDQSKRTYNGFPGYVFGKSILAGMLSKTVKNAIELDKNGFYLKGRDSKGSCLIGSDDSEFNPFLNPVLKFGENLKIQCNLIFNTNVNLKNFCTEKQFQTLGLFNNFVNDLYFGEFGNSNYYFIKDWIKINNITNPNILWIDSNNTCIIPTHQIILIFYKKAGLLGRLQNYLNYISKDYKKNTYLQFDMSKLGIDQMFSFNLEVKFIDLDIDELINMPPETPPFFPRIPKDMFYPIWYESSMKIESYSIIIFLYICFIVLY